MIEIERLDHGMQVIRPESRICVAVTRLVGETVSAQINRDQPECICQVGIHLPAPRQPALREAVNENDWTSLRGTGLPDMKSNAATAADQVRLHNQRRYRLRSSSLSSPPKC